MSERKLGPNAKKLLTHFAARIAIPPGGGLAAGIEAMSRLGDVTREALAQMDQAIAAVRAAPDNPYGADEETIAGAILGELRKR
jgi:hypothetical protein